MAQEPIALESVTDAAGFCNSHAREIEQEIERMGVVLGINWNNEVEVQSLAKEALEHAHEEIVAYERHMDNNYQQKAKVTLYALAAMMMELMAESADIGIHTHGGQAWKAFSKALMKESGINF